MRLVQGNFPKAESLSERKDGHNFIHSDSGEIKFKNALEDVLHKIATMESFNIQY